MHSSCLEIKQEIRLHILGINSNENIAFWSYRQEQSVRIIEWIIE